MGRRTEQLQIRVTPEEKAVIAETARRTGTTVSAYVLSRALPSAQRRLAELVEGLSDASERRYALAEIHDLLMRLEPAALAEAVAVRPPGELSPFLENYLAAMIEQAATTKGIAPPEWLRGIEPLDRPYFAAPLASLRLHLLRSSPVPFRRRNLFVDSAVGDRV